MAIGHDWKNPMSIWNKKFTLLDLEERNKGTMIEYLDIQITEIGENFLRGDMPVDDRTKQPAEIMHGGASLVLAETLGSTAANMTVDESRYQCVGMEINANHIRSVREGRVSGIAKPHHLGRSTQVWEILIYDREERLVCVSRLSISVLKQF